VYRPYLNLGLKLKLPSLYTLSKIPTLVSFGTCEYSLGDESSKYV